VHNLTGRSVLAVGLTGLIGLTLSACGTGDATIEQAGTRPLAVAAPGTVAMDADGVQELTVQVDDDYEFAPAVVTVAPGQVRLTVHSIADDLTHGFRFTRDANPQEISEEISLVGPGQTRTVEFQVNEPGDYQFECSFHIGMGHIGVMTVTPN
jgi:plastocyanin